MVRYFTEMVDWVLKACGIRSPLYEVISVLINPQTVKYSSCGDQFYQTKTLLFNNLTSQQLRDVQLNSRTTDEPLKNVEMAVILCIVYNQRHVDGNNRFVCVQVNDGTQHYKPLFSTTSPGKIEHVINISKFCKEGENIISLSSDSGNHQESDKFIFSAGVYLVKNNSFQGFDLINYSAQSCVEQLGAMKDPLQPSGLQTSAVARNNSTHSSLQSSSDVENNASQSTTQASLQSSTALGNNATQSATVDIRSHLPQSGLPRPSDMRSSSVSRSTLQRTGHTKNNSTQARLRHLANARSYTAQSSLLRPATLRNNSLLSQQRSLLSPRLPGVKPPQLLPHHATRRLVLSTFAQDGDIDMTNLKVSLICPVSRKRLQTPCRMTNCRHLQCFDGETLIKMNRAKLKWRCPVCGNPATYNQLVIDSLFAEILRDAPEAEVIYFRKDGSWSKEKQPDGSRTASPVNVMEQSIISISDSEGVPQSEIEICRIRDRSFSSDSDVICISDEEEDVNILNSSVQIVSDSNSSNLRKAQIDRLHSQASFGVQGISKNDNCWQASNDITVSIQNGSRSVNIQDDNRTLGCSSRISNIAANTSLSSSVMNRPSSSTSVEILTLGEQRGSSNECNAVNQGLGFANRHVNRLNTKSTKPSQLGRKFQYPQPSRVFSNVRDFLNRLSKYNDGNEQCRDSNSGTGRKKAHNKRKNRSFRPYRKIN